MEPDECDVVVVEQQSLITTTDTTVLTSAVEVTLVETTIEKWRGKPLSEMYNLFNAGCNQLLNIEPGRSHTVLFKVCNIESSVYVINN